MDRLFYLQKACSKKIIRVPVSLDQCHLSIFPRQSITMLHPLLTFRFKYDVPQPLYTQARPAVQYRVLGPHAISVAAVIVDM